MTIDAPDALSVRSWTCFFSLLKGQSPVPYLHQPKLSAKDTQVIHAQHNHEPLKLRAQLFGSVKNACRQRICRAIAIVEKRAADAVRPGWRQFSLVTALAAMAAMAMFAVVAAIMEHPPLRPGEALVDRGMHLCVQIATSAKQRRKPTIRNASANSEWATYNIRTLYGVPALLCSPVRFKYTERGSFESQCV